MKSYKFVFPRYFPVKINSFTGNLHKKRFGLLKRALRRYITSDIYPCYSKCGPQSAELTSLGSLLDMQNIRLTITQYRKLLYPIPADSESSF